MILCLIIMERKGGGRFEASAFPVFYFLVGHAVEQGSVVAALRQIAFIVVGRSHTAVGVGFSLRETEQEIRVVGSDVEGEASRPVALVCTVDAHHWFVETHDVGH